MAAIRSLMRALPLIRSQYEPLQKVIKEPRKLYSIGHLSGGSSGLRLSKSDSHMKLLSVPQVTLQTSNIIKLLHTSSVYQNYAIQSALCNKSIIISKIRLHQLEHKRNVIKFSFRKGKRKTVKAVIKRFYRLNWGVWIRRRVGCHKRLWTKSPRKRARLRHHVFCNSTQSRLLNNMVSKFWKKPRYFVDDPYEPYHVRHNIYRGNTTK